MPQNPLWVRDLRNELRCSNSRLQLLVMRSFFSHTVMVPEGYIYVSFLQEKWHVSRGSELRMTNRAVLASDVLGLFAWRLFCFRLSETFHRNSQFERNVPQLKLCKWGQQANCRFKCFCSDHWLEDFAVINTVNFCSALIDSGGEIWEAHICEGWESG